jgi:16S rRNA (guanine966-N2)-methyltransferase
MLGDLTGLIVLDAFAGSGAISFEAISRSAVAVIAIDVDRYAQQTIITNARLLGIQNFVTLVRTDAAAWLTKNNDSFDVVVLDPPYDKPQVLLLAELAHRTKPGGVVVVSLPPKIEMQLGSDFQLLRTKTYGDAQLQLYRCLA